MLNEKSQGRNQNWSLAVGCTLLIDKPLDWTSFDVVNKIRHTLKHHFSVRKIKVGHSGTLDPRATGLLLLCLGKHTKRIDSFHDWDKTYEGVIQLGATTPSFDTETQVDQTFPIDHIDAALVERVRMSFLGQQEQVPPMYSAIKQGGVPAYQAARAGEIIQMPKRPIEIKQFVTQLEPGGTIRFEVTCSKGTYIRSLANDFGQALQSGAYLSSLRRTRIGPFAVQHFWTVEQAIDWIQNGSIVKAMKPI